jgi:hypothetical protein
LQIVRLAIAGDVRHIDLAAVGLFQKDDEYEGEVWGPEG